MAHSFTNTGFETTGGAPGLASGWTFVYFCTAEEFAAFDATVPEAVEDFEEEWSNTDTFWEMPGGAVTANFDTSPAEAFEDFEEEWDNEPHAWLLSGGVSATFDTGVPESVEDFEEEWAADNELDETEFDPGDLTAANFDIGILEAVEDFEEEWRLNHLDLTEFTGGELIAATFDLQTVEDFEEVDLRMQTVEVTAVGADGDTFVLTVNGADIVYNATGAGTINDTRDILITKVNAAAAGAVTSADGLGKIKFRSKVSGDELSLKVLTTGVTAKMVLLDPPDKTMGWTQSGECDL